MTDDKKKNKGVLKDEILRESSYPSRSSRANGKFEPGDRKIPEKKNIEATPKGTKGQL